MQYTLLNHLDESGAADLPPDVLAAAMQAFLSFTSAMHEAGVMRGAAQLQGAATASSVRVRDGERLVTDGPYAETREVFGGWWIVDVPDLDTALDWAARCPGAQFGVVEVRPMVELP